MRIDLTPTVDSGRHPDQCSADHGDQRCEAIGKAQQQAIEAKTADEYPEQQPLQSRRGDRGVEDHFHSRGDLMDHSGAFDSRNRHQQANKLKETIPVEVDDKIEENDQKHIFHKPYPRTAKRCDILCRILKKREDFLFAEILVDPTLNVRDASQRFLYGVNHILEHLHIDVRKMLYPCCCDIDNGDKDDQDQCTRHNDCTYFSRIEFFRNFFGEIVGCHSQQHRHDHRKQKWLINTIGTHQCEGKEYHDDNIGLIQTVPPCPASRA